MDADKVAAVLMACGTTGKVPMNDVLAALAWVQLQKVGPAANAGQLSSDAPLLGSLNAFGVPGRKRKLQEGRRAPNMFLGSGKLPASNWVVVIDECQEEFDECVVKTTLPSKFPKRRPKRNEEDNKAWRKRVDDFTLALGEIFGHRNLVRTKNPDHDIKTSTWLCGCCNKWLRTTLHDSKFDSFQMQGLSQKMIEENVFSLVCALSPAPTHAHAEHPHTKLPCAEHPFTKLPCATNTCQPLMCALAQVRR